jgi:hypothetical protein
MEGTMTDPMRSEFMTHLREMRRHLRWILAAALAVGLAVLALRAAQPDSYRSEATVRIFLDSELADDGSVTEFQTRAFAERVLGEQLITAATDRAGVDLDLVDARERIDVGFKDTPGFVVITASATTEVGATELANAFADELVVAVLADPSAAGGVGAEVIDAATVETATSTKRPLADATFAGLLTALVVGEGIVGWRRLRGRFSPVDPAGDVSRLIGAPAVDLRAGVGSGALLPFHLEYLRSRPVLTVIQVGGAPSVDVARRIGKAAGDVHRRVLLVDGDAGPPVLHTALGQALGPGLAEVATRNATLRSAVRPAGDGSRMAVLTAGNAAPGGRAGSQLLDETKRILRSAGADQVVVSVTQASSRDEVLLVGHAFPDAVVLAIDSRAVGTEALRSLVDELHRVDAAVVGAVIER